MKSTYEILKGVCYEEVENMLPNCRVLSWLIVVLHNASSE